MKEMESDLKWLLQTKADAMKLLEVDRIDLEQAKLNVRADEKIIEDVDAAIAKIQNKQRLMSGKILFLVILINIAVIVQMIRV